MDIKNNWWKDFFNNKFYKIYYRYLRQNYAAYIKAVITFANLKKENKILDLACGSGDYLIALKKKGFNNLAGIDYNYADLAQKNTNSYDIFIKKGDMKREFGANIYDFIMINSTSFGYFDDKENKKVLKNCYKALKPKGKLFINNISKEFILKNFQSKNWIKFKQNIFLLEERKLSNSNRYLLSFWQLFEKGKVFNLSHKLRLYSMKEFKKLFKEAKFKKIKIKKIKMHNWFLAEK